MSRDSEGWKQVAERCVKAAAEAKVEIVATKGPHSSLSLAELTSKVVDSFVPLSRPSNHLEVQVSRRWERTRFAQALQRVLGPDFVVGYHKHPEAHPQNVVFIQPVDDAWNASAWEVNNTRIAKRRRPRY